MGARAQDLLGQDTDAAPGPSVTEKPQWGKPLTHPNLSTYYILGKRLQCSWGSVGWAGGPRGREIPDFTFLLVGVQSIGLWMEGGGSQS